MERVPHPSVTRRQFDFGYFSQESQETAPTTYMSVLGKNAEHPVSVGDFKDRQVMLEYQNADTQEFPLSPILLPGQRIGNTAHRMSGDVSEGGDSKIASQSVTETTRKTTVRNRMMTTPAEVRPTCQKQSPREIQQSQRKRQETQAANVTVVGKQVSPTKPPRFKM